MNTKRIFAAVAGALVAGLVLGSVTSGFAAGPSASGGAPAAAAAAYGALGLQMGSSMRTNGGRLLDIVAKLTGKTTADITAERQAGKTFTQIASEKGVSSEAVVAEALKVRQQVLDAKVKDGSITQAQADTAAASMKANLAGKVDTVNTSCGSGACGAGVGGEAGRGAGRGAGCGGAGCATGVQ